MDSEATVKQTVESGSDLEQNQTSASSYEVKIVENNSNENGDSDEGFESEDDDTSMDLNDESIMDCETANLGADDLQELHKLIREITMSYGDEYNLNLGASQALEEASEAFLIGLFEDANIFAQRQGRTTVKAEDIVGVARLMGINIVKNNNN